MLSHCLALVFVDLYFSPNGVSDTESTRGVILGVAWCFLIQEGLAAPIGLAPLHSNSGKGPSQKTQKENVDDWAQRPIILDSMETTQRSFFGTAPHHEQSIQTNSTY